MITHCLPKNIGDLVDRKWKIRLGKSSLKLGKTAPLSSGGGLWILRVVATVGGFRQAV